MDQPLFARRFREALPVDTVLENPGRGTTTVLSYDGDRLCYRRGQSRFYVDLGAYFSAASGFAGARVTTRALKEHAPAVFDPDHGGHGCHATVLFLALYRTGLSGPITGRGVAGDPYGVAVHPTSAWQLTPTQRCHFRDEFRSARAAALADAEAYERPLHALERFGRFLDPSARSLFQATDALCELAEHSTLATDAPREWPQFHSHFRGLLHSTRHARNDVMHVGSRARHLTAHATEVCAILEDALQEHLHTVADFMVREIVYVEGWYPVSELRRQMLENSFTFVPVRPSDGEVWRLVGDHHLAHYLGDRSERRSRMVAPVEEAMKDGLGWDEAACVEASETIAEVRDQLEHRPVLVTSNDRVIGILAAFDVL